MPAWPSALPYGDAVRTRISSQCLKRHWRVAEDVFRLSRWVCPWPCARGIVDASVMPLRMNASMKDRGNRCLGIAGCFEEPLDKLIKGCEKPKKKSKQAEELDRRFC